METHGLKDVDDSEYPLPSPARETQSVTHTTPGNHKRSNKNTAAAA